MEKNNKDEQCVRHLEVKHIPDSLLNEMKRQFEDDARIRQMRVNQQIEVRNGHLAQALQIGKTIDTLFKRVVASYLEEADEEAKRMDLNEVNISAEDKDEIETLVIAMFMACDILDSLILDANDILHKTDKTIQLEMFDDLKDITKLVKEKINYLNKNSKYMKDLFWAYKTDDMYEMIKNKARAIRRRRKDKNWGKNTEKFEGK
jgi:hypothetical protein